MLSLTDLPDDVLESIYRFDMFLEVPPHRRLWRARRRVRLRHIKRLHEFIGDYVLRHNCRSPLHYDYIRPYADQHVALQIAEPTDDEMAFQSEKAYQRRKLLEDVCPRKPLR